jgi:hypothetical protein
MQALMFLIFN